MKVRTAWGVMWLAAVLVLGSVIGVGAQGNANDMGPAIDRVVKAEIIDSVTMALNGYYVFPEVAKKMEEHARKQLKKGAYDTLQTVGEFAQALSEDLFGICNDRHFRIRYMPRAQVEEMLDTTSLPTAEERSREGRWDNFGFRKVERLPGNIGYLKFNQFSGQPEARETAVGAMNFLGNCDALIVDLRDNGGGDPIMIGLITSYFFDRPMHLNTFYIRETDSLEQYWTSAYVDGRRMDKTPVYVLTSAHTFSGAEEFSYNLKNLKRATIIGETTGGGAHPVAVHGFPNLQVVMRVPYGRAINPISGTNWEGTGVEPDIKCTADQALDVAMLEAYRKLKENPRNDQVAAVYDWYITGLQARNTPVTLDAGALQEYVGDFGPRHVTVEGGSLVYQREGNPKYVMTPMGKDMFMFGDLPGFRVKFVRGANGAIMGLEGHYEGGQVDMSPRT